MAWVRLDENFPDHPKVAQLSAEAGWLWVCALAYCNRLRTDGLIPRAIVTRITPIRNTSRAVKQLIDVGLWHVDGMNYVVHDYLDFQPSAEKIRSEIEKKRESGRIGGKQKASRVLDQCLDSASGGSLAKSKPDPIRSDPSRSVSISDGKNEKSEVDETGDLGVEDVIQITSRRGWRAPNGGKTERLLQQVCPVRADELSKAIETTESKAAKPNVGYLADVIRTAREKNEAQSQGPPPDQRGRGWTEMTVED